MNLAPINPNNFLQVPNANILPAFMAFQEPFTWNVQSGSGSGSNQPIYGNRSLRIVSNVSTGVVINSGGTQTQFTIDTDGSYFFSFSVLEADLGVVTNSVQADVVLFINGTPLPLSFFTLVDENGKNEKRYFFQQLILSEFDVISIGFQVASSDVGLTYRLFFSDMKLEKNIGLGMPTVYSPPITTLFNGTFLTNDDPVRTATVVNGLITTII